jgi:hypothetical protein
VGISILLPVTWDLTGSEISRIFYWTAWPNAVVQSGTVAAELRTVYASLKDGKALDPGLSDGSPCFSLRFSKSRRFWVVQVSLIELETQNVRYLRELCARSLDVQRAMSLAIFKSNVNIRFVPPTGDHFGAS